MLSCVQNGFQLLAPIAWTRAWADADYGRMEERQRTVEVHAEVAVLGASGGHLLGTPEAHEPSAKEGREPKGQLGRRRGLFLPFVVGDSKVCGIGVQHK